MDNIRYHQVLPDNDRPNGFNEYNTAEFTLTADQTRALVCGSVRIEGDVLINETGTDAVKAGTRITIDNHVGAHAFFDNVSVVLSQGGGQIENIDNYGRWVKMVNSATSSEDDNHRADALCELRSPNLRHTEYLLKKRLTKSQDSTLAILPDMSVALKCCLNRPIQGNFLDFAKTGSIRVQVKFARNVSVLSGVDSGTASFPAPNYTLSNLRCVFKSVIAQNQPTVLQRVLSMNQSLESNNSTVSTSVPAVVNAVSAVFLTQSRENNYLFNNFALERPDNISNIQMNYNDTTNAYQTFRLDNQQEILSNYLESLRSAGINDAKLNKVDSNDCFGAGIDFKENIDFSSGNKFSLQIESGIDNSQPVILFLYFHSLVSV